MPDEPEYAAAQEPARDERTTEQMLHDIEALLLEVRDLLKQEVGTGTGRLGH